MPIHFQQLTDVRLSNFNADLPFPVHEHGGPPLPADHYWNLIWPCLPRLSRLTLERVRNIDTLLESLLPLPGPALVPCPNLRYVIINWMALCMSAKPIPRAARPLSAGVLATKADQSNNIHYNRILYPTPLQRSIEFLIIVVPPLQLFALGNVARCYSARPFLPAASSLRCRWSAATIHRTSPSADGRSAQ